LVRCSKQSGGRSSAQLCRKATGNRRRAQGMQEQGRRPIIAGAISSPTPFLILPVAPAPVQPQRPAPRFLALHPVPDDTSVASPRRASIRDRHSRPRRPFRRGRACMMHGSASSECRFLLLAMAVTMEGRQGELRCWRLACRSERAHCAIDRIELTTMAPPIGGRRSRRSLHWRALLGVLSPATARASFSRSRAAHSRGAAAGARLVVSRGTSELVGARIKGTRCVDVSSRAGGWRAGGET
jgi:hypothetical protein